MNIKTKKQRNKETKTQRYKDTKKQRNQETKMFRKTTKRYKTNPEECSYPKDGAPFSIVEGYR